MDCTACTHLAQTTALISRVVTVKLIHAFVFTYVESKFSHFVANITSDTSLSLSRGINLTI